MKTFVEIEPYLNRGHYKQLIINNYAETWQVLEFFEALKGGPKRVVQPAKSFANPQILSNFAARKRVERMLLRGSSARQNIIGLKLEYTYK